MGWKASLETGHYAQARLYLFRRGFGDKAEFVEPLVFKVHDRGELAQPTMYDVLEDVQDGLPGVKDFMQAILDEAWAHGMRPKHFEEHTNELKAVKYHLEDMRKLAKAV